MNIKQNRTIQEWEELVERYFDALTTDVEEQELKSFLLSSEAVVGRNLRGMDIPVIVRVVHVL